MINTTALQVTNFNFYGDDLIALKDNATGEIYTAINSVLRNIGFTERQVRHNRNKWMNDSIISKGCQNFVIPDKNGSNQDTLCISDRKLPIALTKITITPSMKNKQPELASRLELYQDKCADVLASVFIDHKTPDQVSVQQYIHPIVDSLDTFAKTVNDTLQSMNNRILKLEEAHIQATQPQQPAIQNKRGFKNVSEISTTYGAFRNHTVQRIIQTALLGTTKYISRYRIESNHR